VIRKAILKYKLRF